MSKGEFRIRIVLAILIAITFAICGLSTDNFWALVLAFLVTGLAIVYVLVGE